MMMILLLFCPKHTIRSPENQDSQASGGRICKDSAPAEAERAPEHAEHLSGSPAIQKADSGESASSVSLDYSRM
jgi:hypothetical protein